MRSIEASLDSLNGSRATISGPRVAAMRMRIAAAEIATYGPFGGTTLAEVYFFGVGTDATQNGRF